MSAITTVTHRTTPPPAAGRARVIRIRTGPAVTSARGARTPEATAWLLGQPITRAEWDEVRSAGRDPYEWFTRIPREQTTLPQGDVGSAPGAGVRFRVAPNVTVWRWN